MEQIKHKGVIIDIDPQYTSVQFVVESACSACHAKSLCAMSESESKVVQVPTSSLVLFEKGEQVNVCLKASMGHKAVWLAYVCPLVVLVASLFILLGLGAGELVSGLGCLVFVAFYYLIIFLLRNKLRDEYVFKIEKL